MRDFDASKKLPVKVRTFSEDPAIYRRRVRTQYGQAASLLPLLVGMLILGLSQHLEAPVTILVATVVFSVLFAVKLVLVLNYSDERMFIAHWMDFVAERISSVTNQVQYAIVITLLVLVLGFGSFVALMTIAPPEYTSEGFSLAMSLVALGLIDVIGNNLTAPYRPWKHLQKEYSVIAN